MSSPTPQPSVSARERQSFGEVSEAAEFVAMLGRFERGELSSEEYRQYRLTRGIYGQRREGVHMVRVKIPQGVLSAGQLRALADASETWSRGYGHLTTRQNLQFHDVLPESVGPLMEAVARAGLTTREACSHTVRNVVGCPLAGVCAGAAFDVTPYGEVVSRYFLRAPLGSGLPRKFKIALSGCPDDCALAAMNDLGLVAKVEDGRRGFKVTAGGGTSTMPRSGEVLHEFLPAGELLVACEALLRVFNAEGERKDLKKARLKWAIKRLGWARFRELYQQQFDLIVAAGGRPLAPMPEEESAPPPPPPAATLERPLPAAFHAWRDACVREQKQQGFFTATLWLPLGDISGRQLRALAGLVERHGDGAARTDLNQNLVLRWIPEAQLAALWLGLDAAGLGRPHAGRISDVVSCPGAETCRIAVTASRGAAQHIGERLRARGVAELPGDIKISGCPNGCGQHHVAAIGLQGGVRRLGERLAPQYHLSIGGGVDGRGATFGRMVAKIPAQRVAEAIERLVVHFEQHHEAGETFRAFFQRLEPVVAKALLADLAELEEATARPEDFVDLGSTVEFRVVETPEATGS